MFGRECCVVFGQIFRAFDAVLESLSPHEPARVLSAALVSAIKMSRVIGERTDELVARLEQLLERPEDEVRGLVRSAAANIYGEDHPIARSGPRPKMLDLGSLPIDHAIYGGGWEISSHPKFGRA